MGKRVDVHQQLRLVASRDDLAVFVGLLHDDLNANPDAWENATLDRFLDAMRAWLSDTDGLHMSGTAQREAPTWRTFAEILSAARIYE